HGDPISHRLVHKRQCDLWFGQELNVVRNMSFFRRVGLSAHSLGRYVCAAIRHWKVDVANDKATLTTAFSTLPRLPLYCRLTPTVWLPLLAVPVSSITRMDYGTASSAETSLRKRGSPLSWSHLSDSRNRWSSLGGAP